MKRIICLFLGVTLLFLAACRREQQESTAPLTQGEVEAPQVDPMPDEEEPGNLDESPVVREIGAPLGNAYGGYHGFRSAYNVWDLELYDGRLFIGSGDYSDNTGPCPIYSYNTQADAYVSEEDRWALEGYVNDECISRFYLIDGKLTACGTDPLGKQWDIGQYYVRAEDGTWQTVQTLPYGIHNFALCEYDGALFASIGMVPGDETSPVLISRDDGKTFDTVEFYLQGADRPIDFSVYNSDRDRVRSYDLFVHEGVLYATLAMSTDYLVVDGVRLYRYENGAFHEHTNLSQTPLFGFTSLPFTHLIGAVQSFGSRVFLTRGRLCETTDFSTFSQIKLEDYAAVWDLYVCGDTLYALATRPSAADGFDTAVFAAKEEAPTSFEQVFSISYAYPCRSLATDGKTFYLGTASSFAAVETEYESKAGMVLCVTLS